MSLTCRIFYLLLQEPPAQYVNKTLDVSPLFLAPPSALGAPLSSQRASDSLFTVRWETPSRLVKHICAPLFIWLRRRILSTSAWPLNPLKYSRCHIPAARTETLMLNVEWLLKKIPSCSIYCFYTIDTMVLVLFSYAFHIL